VALLSCLGLRPAQNHYPHIPEEWGSGNSQQPQTENLTGRGHFSLNCELCDLYIETRHLDSLALRPIDMVSWLYILILALQKGHYLHLLSLISKLPPTAACTSSIQCSGFCHHLCLSPLISSMLYNAKLTIITGLLLNLLPWLYISVLAFATNICLLSKLPYPTACSRILSPFWLPHNTASIRTLSDVFIARHRSHSVTPVAWPRWLTVPVHSIRAWVSSQVALGAHIQSCGYLNYYGI